MYNKAFSLAVRMAYAFSGLAVTFVLARQLDVDTFAYFNSLAASIAVLMPLLAMGGGPLLIRQGVSSTKNLSYRLGRIQKFYSIVLISGTIITAAISARSEYTKIFFLVWLNVMLYFYSEMFRSRQRYTLSFMFGNGAASSSTSVQGLLSITLLLMVVFLIPTIERTNKLINILVAASLLPFLIMAYNSFTINTWRGKISFKWAATYIKLGIPFAFTGLAFALIAVQELIYLTIFHSSIYVAEYSLLIRLTSITIVIFTILSAFAQPIFLTALKRVDAERNIIKIRLLSIAALICCLGSTIILILRGPELICFFGGPNYCSIDRNLITIRSIGLIAYISVGFSSGLLLVVPNGVMSALKSSLAAILIFWFCATLLPLSASYKAAVSFLFSFTIYATLLAIQLKRKTGYSFFFLSNFLELINAQKNSNRRPG